MFIAFIAVFTFTISAHAISGRSLFRSKGCIACHAINGVGASVGPSLSHIGSKRSLSWIKTQIVNPSAHFAAGSTVVLNGNTYMAIMPSHKNMPEKDVNAIAEYLESLGNKNNNKTSINTKANNNNSELMSEFNNRTDTINNDIDNIEPNTLNNISTLLSLTSGYISFLRYVIKNTTNTTLQNQAESNIEQMQSDQNNWIGDREQIVQWCNDIPLQYSTGMPLGLDLKWDRVCK
jgi:cytochrome c551/c552